ncbi:MAG: phosphatidate cytidylyltransferase [Thermodesulfobacteriota bacterium]
MKEISKKKILTGGLLVPPILFLIVIGPSPVLSLMVLLATFFGLREFYILALPNAKGIERLTGIGLGLILSFLIIQGDLETIFPFLALLLFLVALLFLAIPQNLPSTISRMGILLFGILYIGFLLPHIALIRKLADGRVWVLFLILTVWAGDIFAFLSGSLIGKHKLYPKISPNKTYEGLGGAVGGSVLVAWLYRLFFIPQMGMGSCILLAAALSLLGQMGDLTESMLKRSAQVKDSGSLIPGHGGMLDRMDSFLFSAPFLHYFLLFFLKEAK